MISFDNVKRAKRILICLMLSVYVVISPITSANDTDAISITQDKEKEQESIKDTDEIPQATLDQNPNAYYRQEINKIFDGKDFNGKRNEKAWRLKEKFTDKEEREGRVPDWIISIIEFFESNTKSFTTFAKVIEVVLWVFFGSMLIYLLLKYRKPIQKFVANFGTKQRDEDLPSEMFGLDVRQESLPEDIVLTAKKLWHDDARRESFGLLLRGALSKLLHDYACQFQAGDTEMDCCQRVAELGNQTLDQFMRDLTAGWQQLAYAHQTPSQQMFDNICQTWEKVFDAR